MKRFTLIASVLGLGMAASVPSMAKADGFGPRVDVRVEHGNYDGRYRSDDFDHAVDTREVPRRVLDSAYDLGNGRSIRWVRHIVTHGRSYYLVHMDARNKVDLDLRITPSGQIFDLDRDPNHDGH